MFDPRIGRWLTQDPIDFKAGDPNLYRYVGNSPTNATDPSGLQGAPAGRDPRVAYLDAWYAARRSDREPVSYIAADGRRYRFTVAYDYFTNRELTTLITAIGNVRDALDQVLRDIPPVPRGIDTYHRDLTTVFDSLPANIQRRLSRWFGGRVNNVELYHIRWVFTAVRNGIDNSTLNFENDPEGEEGTHAWVFPCGVFSSDIHLAPSFYVQTSRRRAGIIFHELTHYYSGTLDEGYFGDAALARTPGVGPAVDWDRPNAPSYTLNGQPVNRSQSRLTRNADSYEGFLEDYYLENVSDRR